MTWVKIDDRFDEHPKVVGAGPLGLALQVRAICYCARNLTDGFVSDAIVKRLTADLDPHPETMADLMVQAGLWERRDGGFKVHDYLDYNPTREAVLGGQEQRREAGRRGGMAKSSNRNPSGSLASRLAFATSKPLANACPVPDPDPVTTTAKATTQGAREGAEDRDRTETDATGSMEAPPPAAVAPMFSPGDSSAYCEACATIFRTLNELTCRTYGASGPGRAWCHERHREHGVDTVLAVVRDRVKAWGADPGMHSNLAPATLFKLVVFDRWRNSLGGPVRGDSGRLKVADLARIAKGRK